MIRSIEPIERCYDCSRELSYGDEFRRTYGVVRCADCYENAREKEHEHG